MTDPRRFIIPCSIGPNFSRQALCNLGASINLMLLSIYKRVGLGEVKPTTVKLQLADRLYIFRGEILNILAKMDKFIFPTNFVVLVIEEDRDVPFIMGHPFLATR